MAEKAVEEKEKKGKGAPPGAAPSAGRIRMFARFWVVLTALAWGFTLGQGHGKSLCYLGIYQYHVDFNKKSEFSACLERRWKSGRNWFHSIRIIRPGVW